MAQPYRALNDGSLPDVLASVPQICDQLGGAAAQWSVQEIGDGNLNLVFVVTGPQGSVVVKQALPYVRLVGDSWPLPLSRSYYEHMALTEQARHVPKLVPKIYHYDRDLALIVMEYLTPHIIMRKGLIQGIEYPLFASHIQRRLATISQAHQTAHLETPTKAAEVRAVMQGIRRAKGTAQRQKQPAVTQVIRAGSGRGHVRDRVGDVP